MLALLGGLGYSLWRFLWLPIRARISLDDVALKLEAKFPELNDRLASAVNFMTHPHGQAGAVGEEVQLGDEAGAAHTLTGQELPGRRPGRSAAR